jgi:hypothetical protein
MQALPRRRTGCSLALAVALGLGGACRNKLTGELVVDGLPLTVQSCRSGEAGGFFGVDLVETDGRKLRLVALPSGQASALLFEPGATTAVELGPCGVMSISRQNSTVNDVRNVMGRMTLGCASAGHAVKGALTFENCH